MLHILSAPLDEHVLQQARRSAPICLVAPKAPATKHKTYLNDAPTDHAQRRAALEQRVEHDRERGAERPNYADDDPRREPAHAVDRLREEERERDEEGSDVASSNGDDD